MLIFKIVIFVSMIAASFYPQPQATQSSKPQDTPAVRRPPCNGIVCVPEATLDPVTCRCIPNDI